MERVIAAARIFTKRCSVNSVVISVGIAVMLVFEFYCWMRPPNTRIEDPRVLVALRDLPQGHPITFGDFTIRSVPVAQVDSSWLTDQDWHRLDEKVLRTSIKAGGTLSWQLIAKRPRALPTNKRRPALAKTRTIQVITEQE